MKYSLSNFDVIQHDIDQYRLEIDNIIFIFLGIDFIKIDVFIFDNLELVKVWIASKKPSGINWMIHCPPILFQVIIKLLLEKVDLFWASCN